MASHSQMPNRCLQETFFTCIITSLQSVLKLVKIYMAICPTLTFAIQVADHLSKKE